MPERVARFARAFSSSTGFDRGAVLVAAVGAAAAVIDDRYRLAVRPGAGWFASARLWSALIGGPSVGKSPVIRAATDPIKVLHTEAWERWQLEKRDRKKDENENKGEEEPAPSLFTSDCTLEALSDVLKANPRGILMLTEEFASWIGSIDAYRNGQGSRDRGEMLQLYDVALTFHLLISEGVESGDVAPSTVEMTCRFLRTARKHAVTLFSDILQASPVRELARSVGRSIAAADDAPGHVSRAWLSSHCRQFRDAPDHQRRAAVEFLEDASWIRPAPDSRTYGAWSTSSWTLNPGIWERFSEVGAEHTRRRASVRAVLLGDG